MQSKKRTSAAVASTPDRIVRIEGELARLSSRIERVRKADSSSKEMVDEVWFCYLSIERSIALLKLETRYDSHDDAREVKVVKRGFAEKFAPLSEYIAYALSSIREGKYIEAIKTLRDGRDILAGVMLGMRAEIAKERSRD
jgi:hypothetical protein